MTAEFKSFDHNQLMNAARTASQKAYAPYSHFPVGAALLAFNGDIFTGVNVENVSYGLTICAERSAIAQAVSHGHQKFQAIAVWAEKMPNGAVTPCGACRQVLAEFMQPDSLVLIADVKHPNTIRQLTMASLLPEVFAPALAPDGNSPRIDSSKLPD
jgi:cytidine deaminase